MSLCKKVLVIDDDPFTLDRVATILANAGYVVETMVNPTDALHRCTKAPQCYGVVFIDVCFPEGNVGYCVAQRLSMLAGSRGPNIIGMTGYMDLYDYDNRSEFGMVDVILKPLHEHLVVQLADAHFKKAS